MARALSGQIKVSDGLSEIAVRIDSSHQVLAYNEFICLTAVFTLA
jgi:hypothetical protein